MINKKSLRKHYRSQRQRQPSVIPAFEGPVLDQVSCFAAKAPSKRWLGLYWPLTGEVDLRFLCNHYDIALPRCDRDGTMTFRHWDQAPLKPDGFGIPAPGGGEDLKASDLFLMLVPALAVDRHAVRLGYGGGFYDRLRARHEWRAVPALVVVESAFLSETPLPRDHWDVPFDGWITDQEAGKPEIPAAS